MRIRQNQRNISLKQKTTKGGINKNNKKLKYNDYGG
jgi:hypothetical protein